ncbi:hypothetical protein AVEN_215036-1, partial [Araneus ventricosus]
YDLTFIHSIPIPFHNPGGSTQPNGCRVFGWESRLNLQVLERRLTLPVENIPAEKSYLEPGTLSFLSRNFTTRPPRYWNWAEEGKEGTAAVSLSRTPYFRCSPTYDLTFIHSITIPFHNPGGSTQPNGCRVFGWENRLNLQVLELCLTLSAACESSPFRSGLRVRSGKFSCSVSLSVSHFFQIRNM